MVMFMAIPSPAAILGSLIVLLVLDVVAVTLRFSARRRLRQPLKFDDWLTVPALILIFGLSSIMFYGIKTGTLAYPLAETDNPINGWTIVTARRLEYAFLVVFCITNGLVKISVLFLYQRIFVISKTWRDARNFFLVTTMALITMWAISYTFALMFPCGREIESYFVNPDEWAEKCVDTLKLGYSYSISDFTSDSLIILIPVPFVWRLHLPATRKLAVLGIFFLGILAAAASLIRLLWMVWAQHMGFDVSTDEEFMLTEELYWCLMEITLGLLASCLPAISGIFKTKPVDSVVRYVSGILSIRSEPSRSLERSKSGSHV